MRCGLPTSNANDVLIRLGSILPLLLYNGLPAWVPRSTDRGWNRFEYTFVDVRRLHPEAGRARGLIAALSCPATAARIVDRGAAPGLAPDVVR